MRKIRSIGRCSECGAEICIRDTKRKPICVECARQRDSKRTQDSKKRHDKKVRDNVIGDILERIDKGLCEICDHGDDGCYKRCAQEGWERETLLKWLEAQV